MVLFPEMSTKVLRNRPQRTLVPAISRVFNVYKSGGASFVAVVKSTNLGYCEHSSQFRWLDRPRVRRVLVQRKMRPRLVIVGEITRQGSTQRGFSEDEHMVQTLAPNRADHGV